MASAWADLAVDGVPVAAEDGVAREVQGDVGLDSGGFVMVEILRRGRRNADRQRGDGCHRGQEVTHLFRSLSRLPTGLADGLAYSGRAPGSRFGRLAARFAPAAD